MHGTALGIGNPFVGLRSFEPSESLLFHGRKQHTQQLLRVLAQHHFLCVTGTSGSGKSSLVKAGLLPALHRGYLRGASSDWKVAVMRPGSSPLRRLAEALHGPQGLGLATPVDEIAAKLQESSGALVELLHQPGSESAVTNMLLVVDQFEEIFRLRGEAEEAAAYFVGLLLRCIDELEVPIYVVLTMRSEFLGHCAQFAGLAEALSEAQYLIPRLTREQREEAIRGPLDLVHREIEEELVQRLLNDAGTDPDQLPALQHSLMKLFEATPPGGRLTVDGYTEPLRVGRSLNSHAQSIYDRLAPSSRQRLAEKIFRSLTMTEEGFEERRTRTLGQLYAIVGSQSAETQKDVQDVIQEFSRNSLLFFNHGEVEITHESLIRQWDLLKSWVGEEAESAEWFSRLVRSTELGGAGLWGKNDTDFISERMQREGWNTAWGDQYRPGFEKAMEFLHQSRAEIVAADARARQQALDMEQIRERELRNVQELAASREHALRIAEDLAAAKERELETARRARQNLLIALSLAVTVIALFLLIFYLERRILVPILQTKWIEWTVKSKINPRDGQRYVYIAPGKFVMGCSQGDNTCFENEKPPHEVEIADGFWIERTEVTQAAYSKAAGQNPSSVKGMNLPVDTVNWNDAKSYCEAVGMRLPTEAEWEYAARAGSSDATYGELQQVAWAATDQPHPVAGKLPNRWGLYDVLGNVWEWTADWYGAVYYDQKVSKDPPGPASGQYKVVRGGSWYNDSGNVRLSNRVRYDPAAHSGGIGFRCAGELR
jgi:formylglycine-generating enzyme required for sulfatase activity/energy-coupling factor transporter ATP-binding protein EcfA2